MISINVYTEHDHERERGRCAFPRDFPLESSHEPPFIQNAVIRAVAAIMCAGMHYLTKMAANASDRFGCHFGILPFHTEEEKEEDMKGYIYTRCYRSVIFMAITTT